MDSSVSYLDATDRQSLMGAAQRAVRDFEGGSDVVNERYNKNEYRNRRGYFLGIISEPGIKVLPTAAGDAELVFASQPDILSAQAVRARELSCYLDPLLPFPTRDNCLTGTDFDEYSSEEWKVGDPATFPRDHQNSPARSSPDVSDQAQNALPQVPRLVYGQQTANLLPTPMDGTINPRLLSTDSMPPPPGLKNPPSPDTLRQVIYDLQFPLGTRKRPLPKYRAEEGVAALSGRGISVPVKIPQPDRQKRKAAEMSNGGSEHLDSDDDDQATEIESAAPPAQTRPKKRSRKNRKDPQVPVADQASRGPSGAVSSKKKKTEKAVRSEVKWPATVSGNRLPKTVKEAQEAAVERKRVLEEAHIIKHRTARNVDFPPEFFNSYNFNEHEKANIGNDGGPIRCVCGEGEVADKLDWIQCDSETCGVWQHVECMKDAVPETEKRAAAKYLCQVCDPWKHRRLIQKLRRENPDPILAATKVETVDGDDE